MHICAENEEQEIDGGAHRRCWRFPTFWRVTYQLFTLGTADAPLPRRWRWTVPGDERTLNDPHTHLNGVVSRIIDTVRDTNCDVPNRSI